MTGNKFCELGFNGQWGLAQSTVEEIGEEFGPKHQKLDLVQTSGCAESKLRWEGKDKDSIYTIEAEIEFMRLERGSVVQLTVTSIDNGVEAAKGHQGIFVFKIESVSKDMIRVFGVSPVELTKLIDSRSIEGEYTLSAHGAEITISDSGVNVAQYMSSNSKFFSSEGFVLERIGKAN